MKLIQPEFPEHLDNGPEWAASNPNWVSQFFTIKMVKLSFGESPRFVELENDNGTEEFDDGDGVEKLREKFEELVWKRATYVKK